MVLFILYTQVPFYSISVFPPAVSHGGNNRNMTLPTINDNFKITLRHQTQGDANKNPPAAVTSTIPKTPSPNHVQGRSDTERSLDKFCEESVKDLMATIAKLDSNGVQVSVIIVKLD